MKAFYLNILLFVILILLKSNVQALSLDYSSVDGVIVFKPITDGKRPLANRTVEILRIKIENFKLSENPDAKLLIEVVGKAKEEKILSSAIFALKKDYFNETETIRLKKFNIKSVEELRLYVLPDMNILNITCAELEDGGEKQCGLTPALSRSLGVAPAMSKNQRYFRIIAIDKENNAPVTLAKILFVSKGKNLKGTTDVYGMSEKVFKRNTLVAASIEKKGYYQTSTKAFKLKSNRTTKVYLRPNGQRRDTPVPTPGSNGSVPGIPQAPNLSPIPNPDLNPNPNFAPTSVPTVAPTDTPPINPIIVSTLPPTTIVLDGQFVSLACYVSSRRPELITYQWFDQFDNVVSNEQFLSIVGQINLNNARYKCGAKQGAYSAESNYTTIDVRFKPVITAFNVSPQNAFPGRSINISASVQANPAATIKYYRNGIEIFLTNGQYIVRNDDHGAVFYAIATNSLGYTNSQEVKIYLVQI